MLNPLVALPFIPPCPVLVKPSKETCCGEANVGESGVQEFIELSDAPSSYTGQAGKIVGVKSDETGLEFITNSSTSGWRPAMRVSRDDEHWTDDHTYTDVTLTGTTFFVYYNGNKILTPELEGFAILDDGGFTYNPAKFQFYEGEFLYMIF